MQDIAQRGFVAPGHGRFDEVAIHRQLVAQHAAQRAHGVHASPDGECGGVIERTDAFIRRNDGSHAEDVDGFLECRVETGDDECFDLLCVEFGADRDRARRSGPRDVPQMLHYGSAIFAIEALVDHPMRIPLQSKVLITELIQLGMATAR